MFETVQTADKTTVIATLPMRVLRAAHACVPRQQCGFPAAQNGNRDHRRRLILWTAEPARVATDHLPKRPVAASSQACEIEGKGAQPDAGCRKNRVGNRRSQTWQAGLAYAGGVRA
jgi:hypothetical protein